MIKLIVRTYYYKQGDFTVIEYPFPGKDYLFVKELCNGGIRIYVNKYSLKVFFDPKVFSPFETIISHLKNTPFEDIDEVIENLLL